jgi:hypothetical protein
VAIGEDSPNNHPDLFREDDMRWTALTNLALGSLAPPSGPPQDTNKEVSSVPLKLMAPEGHVILFKSKAVGVQIDVCKAESDDPGRFEWVLKAPDAELFDEGGRSIDSHFAGPTWEALEDGSTVIGTLVQKSPAPQADDIPWLLLKRKAGAGTGRFSKVTYIQRVDTEGGIAPSGGCDKAHEGQEVRVKYKATYVFYRPKA